jgi:phosphatidylserine/phosphatidylglycerophosphate/cardiolipin synthase-like enzyme
VKHAKKRVFCCVWLLTLFCSAHGVTGGKEVVTGFGKTHFVIGAQSGQVFSDIAETRLAQKLHVTVQSTGRITHALFCPDDDSRGLLLDLIACEKKAIYFAAFLLTDEVIARALIDAKKRGVVVEVVTDQMCCEERGKAHMLHTQGIEVFVYCGKC